MYVLYIHINVMSIHSIECMLKLVKFNKWSAINYELYTKDKTNKANTRRNAKRYSRITEYITTTILIDRNRKKRAIHRTANKNLYSLQCKRRLFIKYKTQKVIKKGVKTNEQKKAIHNIDTY